MSTTTPSVPKLSADNVDPQLLADDSRLVSTFNHYYYHGPNNEPLYMTTKWLGVPTQKCPLDVWVYQEILYRTQPEIILECGVHSGGSTLYLASMCDLIGKGEIVSCDITLENVYPQVPEHPRVTLLEGSSVSAEIVGEMKRRSKGKRTMVILDSDHSCQHVLNELRAYAPFVTPGCYLICEDTNVYGHPSFVEHGPGPYEAVQAFLKETDRDNWHIDLECERLLVTFNPSGYMLRK